MTGFMKRSSTGQRQRGLTLVELMIAMTIGLVVITAIGNLFISTNKSVTLGDALSRNQETGRFTLEYITNYARLAGYSEDGTMPDIPLYVTSNHPSLSVNCAGADADACAADDVTGIRGDRLALPYYASSRTLSDCTGGQAGGALAARYVVNVFWVNAEGVLMCRAFDGQTKAWLTTAASPILTGIETMEVLVGVSPNEESFNVSRYVSISDVITDGLNNQVRALRVSVLVTSQEQDANAAALETNKQVRTYAVLDKRLPDFEDGFLRHIFTTTIDFTNSRYN